MEEYLRLNSEKLSSHIQHYFDRSDNDKYISLDQKVEGLCLVAWERKEFTKKILRMQKAFRQRLVSVRIKVESKTKKAVQKVKSEMARLFKIEYIDLLNQFG